MNRRHERHAQIITQFAFFFHKTKQAGVQLHSMMLLILAFLEINRPD